MEEIKINIDADTRSLADMKRELKDIKAEMVGVSDPTQFAELATKAAELETEFRRVNSAVAELSASGDELPRMSRALGGIGGSLARLDFSAANEGAGRLLQISRQMTFKTAITGIKNLGSTFINLGKALLANPLFLLAAVIAGIAVGIFKLLDSLGLIKKMFDIISDAIGWVIQLLKDLLDWLGLTSFAEDEAAARAAQREENLQRIRAQAYKEHIDNKEHEIEMMKIQGASIEEIEEAEINLARIKAKTAKDNLKAQEAELEGLIKLFNFYGRNTEELENQLFALRDAAREAEQELEKTEARIEKARENRTKKSEEEQKQSAKRVAEARKKIAEDTEKFLLKLERQREDLKITQIEDEIDREEELALLRLKRQQEDIDFTKMNAEAKLQWDIWYQSEVDRIEAEAKSKREERERISEENHQKELANMREAFNLSIQEKVEKSEEQLRQEKFEKEMEDLNNLLEAKAITEEEFNELKLQREQKLSDDLKKLEKDRLDEESRIRKVAQKEAIDSGVEMFNKLALLSEEGSAVQKASALVSIIAAQAESLAKAVPVALEASKGTGPGAPFVFGATLAGIIGSIGASIASARSVLQSAPGPSPSGGGGGGVISSVTPSISQSSTPQFSLFGQANETGGDTSQFNAVERNGQQQTIRAVVSWTDIDAVSNSDNSLKQEMQL